MIGCGNGEDEEDESSLDEEDCSPLMLISSGEEITIDVIVLCVRRWDDN